MADMPGILHLAIGALALAALGAAIAKLLALAGIAGGVRTASVLAGASAGVLLGAGVLAGLAPETHERWFVGAVAQREALDALASRQAADIAALSAVDASPVAIEEQLSAHRRDRAPLEAALADARALHSASLGAVAGGALVLALILAGLSSARAGAGRDGDGDLAIAAGLSSVVVATLASGGAALLLAPVGVREALAFGAAGAIGGCAYSGRFALAPTGRRPRVRQSAAVAALVGAALVAGAARGGLLASSVLIGVALSLAAPLLLPLGGRARRRIEAIAFVGVAPLVVGLALVRLDPGALASDRLFWIGAIASAILHHDGRWLGAWLAWRLFGGEIARREAWRRSGAILESGVGMTQCAGAVVLVYAGALPPALGAGLVVSAIVIEISAPLRIRAAAWMDRGFGMSA